MCSNHPGVVHWTGEAIADWYRERKKLTFTALVRGVASRRQENEVRRRPQ